MIRKFTTQIETIYLSFYHLKCFQSYLNSRRASIPFTIENDKDNRLSCFYIKVILEEGKFTTFIQRKPSSRMYIYCGSFLPFTKASTYKDWMIGMIHTLPGYPNVPRANKGKGSGE